MTVSPQLRLMALGLSATVLLIVATGCGGGGAMSSSTTPPVTLPSSGALALGSVTAATWGRVRVLSYPNTYLHFVFGGQDNTAGVALAQEWLTQITAKNGPGTAAYACVADAPHMIPNVLDGATTIANDIIANCHK